MVRRTMFSRVWFKLFQLWMCRGFPKKVICCGWHCPFRHFDSLLSQRNLEDGVHSKSETFETILYFLVFRNVYRFFNWSRSIFMWRFERQINELLDRDQKCEASFYRYPVQIGQVYEQNVFDCKWVNQRCSQDFGGCKFLKTLMLGKGTPSLFDTPRVNQNAWFCNIVQTLYNFPYSVEPS